MRLFLHDKFWDQFIKLPKAIQSKVIEFQKKFKENPFSNAINLESIKTFRDQRLRTARIDQKYRAIIGVSDSGEDFFLLWVDNHDEAMDWAKNKIFQWNDNTQTAQIFTAPEEVLSPIDPNYQEQMVATLLFEEYSDEQLMAIGVPQISLSKVRSIAGFNDLDRLECYIPQEIYESLFYLASGDITIFELIAEVNEGKTKQEDGVKSINNQRYYLEIESDQQLEEIINGELEKWQIFLHPSQRKLVESSNNGPVKVTGGGGTGKTVAAIHRLKLLSQIPNAYILFTTYTHALTRNLESIIGKLQIDKNRFRLINVDAIARELALKHGLITPETKFLDMSETYTSESIWNKIVENEITEFDAEFLFSEYQDVMLYNNVSSLEEYLSTTRIGRGKKITKKQRLEVWRLVEVYTQTKKANGYIDRLELFNLCYNYFNTIDQKPFTNVIVDELQDFSNPQLRFIRSIVSEKKDDLFLVGDPYQRIYISRKINFTSVNINVRGRSKRLRINYRTSEEIKRLAVSTVTDVNYDDFDGTKETLSGYLSIFHGDKPSYICFNSKDVEVSYILNLINNLHESNFKYSDIVVASRFKDGYKDVKSSLYNKQTPYYDIPRANGTTDGVRLCTFHSLKGLEFKVVILIDVCNKNAPYIPQKFESWDESQKNDHLDTERSLLYVAITRAIHKLYITGSSTPSELIRI